MLTINSNDVLPEIFLSAHNFYNDILVSLQNTPAEQINYDVLLGQFMQYMPNGWAYFKGALSDLCIGIKALGDKLGSLGGESFEKLKQQSDALVSATGVFFNTVAGFDVNSGDIASLLQVAQTYFTSLTTGLKEISSATLHLYGDAKNRLADKFEGMANSMVSFIQMAKIKIVAALANAQIALQYAYQMFVPAVSVDAVFPIDGAGVANDDCTVNKEACKQLVPALIVNFDEALAQAQKAYN